MYTLYANNWRRHLITVLDCSANPNCRCEYCCELKEEDRIDEEEEEYQIEEEPSEPDEIAYRCQVYDIWRDADYNIHQRVIDEYRDHDGNLLWYQEQ